MNLVTRDQWGADTRHRALTQVSHPYIEVHHSGVAAHYDQDPLVVARNIERDHRSRGWQGTFYGLELAPNGQIIEGRGIGWRSIGAYEPRYDDGTPVDPRALCVLLHGDYRTNRVTDAQTRALNVIRELVPDKRLRWHSMRANTACPGTNAVATLRFLNTTPSLGDDDVIRPGSTGPTVKALQQHLAFWAPHLPTPDPGPIDGVFGDSTAKSSRAFKSILRASPATNSGELGDTPDWAADTTWKQYGRWLLALDLVALS